MKIGLISDTHDQIPRIEKALEIFREAQVERVYHLGDWCSPFSVELFGRLDCPVVGILGNNDADVFKFFKLLPENVTLKDRFYVDQLEGKRIALIHGDPQELVDAVVESGRYDVVLRGHNHHAEVSVHGKTLLINPGGLLAPYRSHTKWSEPSIAVWDTRDVEPAIIKLA